MANYSLFVKEKLISIIADMGSAPGTVLFALINLHKKKRFLYYGTNNLSLCPYKLCFNILIFQFICYTYINEAKRFLVELNIDIEDFIVNTRYGVYKENTFQDKDY